MIVVGTIIGVFVGCLLGALAMGAYANSHTVQTEPDRTARLRSVFEALGGPGDLESVKVGDVELRFRAPEPAPVEVDEATPEQLIARQAAELFRVRPQDIRLPERPRPKP